jgi:GT2 family glycosyltransferase
MVDWVSGACMLVRRSAATAVGPLDEGFVRDYDDVEWCHRMHDGGWLVLRVPNANCVYVRGRSAAADLKQVARLQRADFDRYCKLFKLRALGFAVRYRLIPLRAAD